MKKIVMYLLLAGAALSCTKESAPSVRPSDEIIFSVGDNLSCEVFTRATAVTSLSKVNWLCTSTASPATQIYSLNDLAVKSGSVSTGVFWPSVSTTYTMYASNAAMTFTKGSSGDGSVTVNPTSNSTDVVIGKKSGVAWKSKGSITLDHIYARLSNVVLTAPAGYILSGATLSMSAPTSGKYELNSDKWTPGTAVAQTFGSAVYDSESTDGNKATLAQDLYVVPGTYTLTCKYTLTKGAYTESFTKSAEITLAKGMKTSITSTLPSGNAAGIEFAIVITAWGDTSLAPVFN